MCVHSNIKACKLAGNLFVRKKSVRVLCAAADLRQQVADVIDSHGGHVMAVRARSAGHFFFNWTRTRLLKCAPYTTDNRSSPTQKKRNVSCQQNLARSTSAPDQIFIRVGSGENQERFRGWKVIAVRAPRGAFHDKFKVHGQQSGTTWYPASPNAFASRAATSSGSYAAKPVKSRGMVKVRAVPPCAATSAKVPTNSWVRCAQAKSSGEAAQRAMRCMDSAGGIIFPSPCGWSCCSDFFL